MKKLTLLSLCILAFTMLFAQQVPQNWVLVGGAITVTEETVTVNEGTSAAVLTWTSVDNQDLDSDPIAVTEGATFVASVDVLDNDAQGRVRIGIFFGVSSTYNTAYTADNPAWQTNTWTGTVPAGATTAVIRIRCYDVTAGWDGDASVIVDNIIYTENGGSNLLPNGGLEIWETPVLLPTLTVTNPTNAMVVNADNVDLTFSVENFVLGTDGKVEYKLNSGAAMYTTTSPVNVAGLVEGSNTLDVQLVDMSDVALDPVVAVSRTFTYEIPSSDPTLTITSPTSGASVYSQDVNIAFTLENFVLGTDGKLAYSIDGGADVYYTGASPLALTGLSFAAHSVDFELVDMTNASLAPAVISSLNFTCVEAIPGGMEPFDNCAATASYADGSFVGNGGITWNYFHSRDTGLYPINNSKGLMLRRASDSKLESATISGGIASFQVSMRKAFTGTFERQLELYINGELKGTSQTFGTAAGADATVYTFTVTDINVPGDFTMMIKNVGTTTDNRQVVIDDISWTGYEGTDPYISISSPADAEEVTVADVNLVFSVANFDLGTDGSVKYIVDASAPQFATASPIALGTLADGPHTVSVELVDMANVPLAPAVTDVVTFTVNTAAPSTTTIYDIQYTTAGDGASPLADQAVTTRGIVVGKNSDKFWIQDGAGAWNGVYVYYATTPSPALGDSVFVSATVVEYNSLTELSTITDITTINTGNTVAAPTVLTTGVIGFEMYEGVYVRTTGVCTNVDAGFGMWEINDGSGPILIDDVMFAYTPTLGNSYTVTGLVDYSFAEWKILPRDAADVVDNGASTDPMLSVSSPTNGSTIYSDNTSVVFTVSNFVLGTDGKVAWNVDGAADAYVTASPIAITGLTEGAHAINLELVDMSNNPLAEPVSVTINITVDFSGPATTPIYDIQYTTAPDGASTLATQTVTTVGIVVGKNSDKFWLQDGTGAWNGVYVFYTSTPSPAMGDSVYVTGQVVEYNGLTEISNITNISNINTGNTIAAPTVLATGSVGAEMYEGVLVRTTGVCTNPDAGFGMFEITDGSGSILVDDVMYDANAVLGNSYTVTGLVDYSFSEWKILPRDAADVIDNGASTEPMLIVSSPADGSTVYADNTSVEFTVSNFVLGTDGRVKWNLDGGANAYVTVSPIAITGLTEGAHTINLELVDMSNASLSPAVSLVIDITVNLAGPVYTNIYDIQYTANANGDSPFNNQTVWVKGIVSASFNSTPYTKGYYLQQGGGAWNSIYIYDQTNSPEIGDSVSLQGQVTEYNGMTEIKTVTNFTRYAIDGIVAPATLLTASSANIENYESCLITIDNAECTEANLAFGEWKINDGSADFTCKDAGGFTFQEVVGTNYRITGVIDFYSYFRLNYRMSSDIVVISSVDSEFANSISLYPNPASDKVTVNVPMGAEVITITNTLGQTVAELSVSTETTIINIENYEAGVYFVKIVNNTNSAVLRLVIE